MSPRLMDFTNEIDIKNLKITNFELDDENIVLICVVFGFL